MLGSTGSGMVNPDSQPPRPCSQVEPPPPKPPNPPPSPSAPPPPVVSLRARPAPPPPVESGPTRPAAAESRRAVLSARGAGGRGRGGARLGEVSGAVLGPRMVPSSCRLPYIQ